MSHAIIGTSAGRNVALDLDALLRGRMLVQANSGKGKSWLLRRLAEQLFGKVQVIIIDPEGEFATLREKYGYVLVGKGGETPADPRSAALVAHKLLELRASAVCDLYEMKPSARHEWVQRFLDAMIDAPKHLWHPCVVMVDESHIYAPEKGTGESVAAEAMIGMATRGRKRGFVLVPATQRLGKLRKDLAAEMQTVLIGGTFIDIDRKRAADTLGVYGAELHAFFDEIKLLERGHFYALGPAISNERILVEVGAVETSHPEAGSAKHAAEPPPAPDAIAKFLPKLSDLPKAAEEKARTEAELRREISELKRKLKAQPTVEVAKTVADPKAIARAVMAATKEYRDLLAKQARIFTDISRMAERILTSSNREASQEILSKRAEIIPKNIPGGEIHKGEGLIETAKPRVGAAVGTTVSKPRPVRDSDEVQLKAGARRMLTVLAQWHPDAKTRDELGALAGFAPTGGTFSDYLSKLRMSGFISENGNGIHVTDEGIRYIDQFQEIPPRPDSTEELVSMWRLKFKAGVGRMLDVLVEAHPEFLTRDELGERSGFSTSGGTFGDYLSQLRRARLIEEQGGAVKAAESLFP